MTSCHIFAAALLMSTVGPAAAQSSEVEVPYWASISVDQARMRQGPSPHVPVLWAYRRTDLPVKVISANEIWRKVEHSSEARSGGSNGDSTCKSRWWPSH